MVSAKPVTFANSNFFGMKIFPAAASARNEPNLPRTRRAGEEAECERQRSALENHAIARCDRAADSCQNAAFRRIGHATHRWTCWKTHCTIVGSSIEGASWILFNTISAWPKRQLV
jgi:hypothetical protein